MNISIFGLGYVGAVISGCFARDGHHVIGVDTDAGKVDLIKAGRSPIIEPGLEVMIAAGVRSGNLRATCDCREAVLASDLAMVCVGTPSKPTGQLDLQYVKRVCEEIGDVIAETKKRFVVVIRSTMLPGSVSGTVIPALERHSGKIAGKDFGIAINPEFLRESSAVDDFYHPPKTVIGSLIETDARVVAELYKNLAAPLICTRLETAEMVKYADNAFHALKITFANEIGSICKQHGIDSHEVMKIFCEDRKLNIAATYLKPGFAFGGSCLPKDLRALTSLAISDGIETPMLQALLASNEVQIRRLVLRVIREGKKKIGILGFAFKGGTDDLRESPVVTLIETFIGKGYEVRLYDPCVTLAKLGGANRRYLEEHIPHITRLMVPTIKDVTTHSDIILIGNSHGEFFDAVEELDAEKHVIDLTSDGRLIRTRALYERVSG